MLQAIKSARESIYFEMYIFANDTPDFDFFSILKEKAESGIRVCMLLDSFGSVKLSNMEVAELRQSGIEIIFLSYFWHRLHRKILIVDEHLTFLGGVNIHKSAQFWADLMISIESRTIVERVVRSFARDYASAGGNDPQILLKNKKVLFHQTQTWIIDHLPLKNIFGMRSLYKKQIHKAQNNITLVTPYFMPKRYMLALLHQATLRGVEVNILVPQKVEKSFYNIMNKANYFYLARAQKLGLNIYLEPFMNHAKVMLVDDKEGVVGSQNLDFLSFELNSEVGLFIKDKNIIVKLIDIVTVWKNQAKPFSISEYKLSVLDKVLAHFLNFFVKML